MKRGGGFTLIELMVTITIMVILLAVGVVSLISSQANARDKERETDMATLARGLEGYYLNGNPYIGISKGYYPGGVDVITAAGTTPPFADFLEGVSKTSFEAPNMSAANSFGVDPNYATSAVGNNTDGSYDDTQARALLASIPYLYQPLTRNNAFCADYANCVKFNLYYLTETDNALHKIRSKNQ